MNDDNENNEILNDRLRGLAAATESEAAVPRPDDVRARGIRRRNRIRVGGAATMAACVIAVSAWVAVPGDDEPAGRTGSAASSGAPTPTRVDVPEAVKRDLQEAVAEASRNPKPPVKPEGPSLGPIDLSFLPQVPGVTWSPPLQVNTTSGFDNRLYGPCSGIDLLPSHGGSFTPQQTPAGSRMQLAVSSTYGSARSPAQNELDAVQMVTAWSTLAQSCMTRQPGGGDDTAVWSWQADGKRGQLVITRRGHRVGLVATEMVASDPDYSLAPTIGSELLDHANLKD